jgi:NitT/TauT family transport system substrate-binding protein
MSSLSCRLLSLVLGAVLVGCGSGAAPPSPRPAGESGASVAAASATPLAARTESPAPAAPASPSPASPAPAPIVSIKLGTLSTVADGPQYLAAERGYFREEGLDVSFENFGSTADMTAPLASGELDLGSGSATAGLVNAVARGIGIKLVADRGQYTRGHSYAALVVRKELDGQVESLRDLKGRRVAVPSPFSPAEIQLDVGLKALGLSTTDLDMTILPYPDQVAALGNGAIDATVMLEPLVTRAVQTGVGVRLKGVDEFYPDYQAAEILYGPVFAQAKAAAAQRWMVAYLRGIREFNAAFEQGQDKTAVVRILTEHTSVKDAALYDQMVMPRLQPDGYLNLASIQTDVAWYAERDLVKEQPSTRTLVDYQYLDYAHGRLGRLGPRQEVE